LIKAKSEPSPVSTHVNILVDTGIGDYTTDRQKKIYRPSKSTLVQDLNNVGLTEDDINIVVLSHLHHDHAGGILNEEKNLIFRNAKYVIQRIEYETALNPDPLNIAAYSLTEHYKKLSEYATVELIDGSKEIYDNIFVELIEGHSNGMQMVKIIDGDSLIIYAGDAFPSRFHLPPAITSAYELSRKDLYLNKENIIAQLKKHNGKLILSHDREEPVQIFV
jgi:glyoxylase-like metal-dependent hydrolase (beta-lactamase superfamily II)